MAAELNGTDSVTKSAIKGNVNMTLTSLGPRETRLGYHATVDVKGRLAILGDMVLRATANLMLEEFTRRLSRKLEAADVA
jgi:carbon monoxide dehydrogenase subunit G